MENLDKKVVIFIDDIDRLKNEEICLLFRLVTSLAKFPNVVYVLSYDEEIAARALHDIQNCDGHFFLEKTVQIRIQVPAFDSEELENLLFSGLDDLIVEYSSDVEFDRDYWSNCYWNYIRGKVSSLRDIYRLLNALEYRCMLIGKEVNIIDLIVLTTMELYDSKLYKWIRENKDQLVLNSTYHIVQSMKYTETDLRKVHENELCELDENNAVVYMSVLDLLFPCFNQNGGFLSSALKTELRKAHHVGSSDCFDRYFAFSLKKNDISDERMHYLLKKATEEELYQDLVHLYNNKGMANFLMGVIDYRDDLSDERRKILACSLIALSVMIPENEAVDKGTLFSFGLYERLTHTVCRLLQSFQNKGMVEKYFLELLDKADADTITVLAEVIRYAENGTGWNGTIKATGNIIFEKDAMARVENAFVTKMATLSQDPQYILMDHKSARLLLYLWEKFNKMDKQNYLDRLSTDAVNVMKLVSLFCIPIRSTGKPVLSWEYEKDDLTGITNEQAERALKKSLSDGTFNTLPKEIQKNMKIWAILKQNNFAEDEKVAEEDIENRWHQIETNGQI